MKFEIGWVVIHKATGEPAVVVAGLPIGAEEPTEYSVSCGLDKAVVKVPAAALRRENVDDSPPPASPFPLSAPADAPTIQAIIGGERMSCQVIDRGRAGLICTAGNGVHLIRESDAIDKDHYRQLYDAADDS